MGSSLNPITTPSEAHPETMDFLSTTWCNFAVQALQPDLQDQSIALLDNPIKSNKAAFVKMEDDAEFGSVPPLKSNDFKSWLWMQQAMHPELNYSGRKKWFPWKLLPFKTISIKKWLKEIKLKRKEEQRLQNAQMHSAISVAGLAAAVAAIAAENKEESKSMTSREAAVASAAALVAAQCAQFAQSMGANREQLSSVIRSAMNSTSASDILTLSAAAATSLRGAAALKARGGCKNRVNGSAHVLPIEDNNDFDLDFDKCKSILANGAELGVETQDGNYIVTSVSITLNSESKVILKMKKLNMLKTKKQCVVLDMHAELYKDSKAHHDQESESATCYLIVLSTNKGAIKLDMADDYHGYKTWTTTISRMLMLSSSFTNYELQFYTK